MVNVFYDTEFIDTGLTIDLISLGAVVIRGEHVDMPAGQPVIDTATARALLRGEDTPR